ncbi:MAG: hypothetical protein A2096_07480 [Spirochaetes bacterium GWF1_41_5]|nr:MAG: hypothetical protein A2096_07480 [Spirochaetes bacterium GWF1_41_5]HBE02385.1 hypothetical protein [Spirochaetia bacterium]
MEKTANLFLVFFLLACPLFPFYISIKDGDVQYSSPLFEKKWAQVILNREISGVSRVRTGAKSYCLIRCGETEIHLFSASIIIITSYESLTCYSGDIKINASNTSFRAESPLASITLTDSICAISLRGVQMEVYNFKNLCRTEFSVPGIAAVSIGPQEKFFYRKGLNPLVAIPLQENDRLLWKENTAVSESRMTEYAVLLGKASYYISTRQNSEARRYLQILNMVFPGEWRTHYLSGKLHLSSGNREQALAAFKLAGELEKNTGSALYQIFLSE